MSVRFSNTIQGGPMPAYSFIKRFADVVEQVLNAKLSVLAANGQPGREIFFISIPACEPNIA